jgi:type IV secretory pathway component VirB8
MHNQTIYSVSSHDGQYIYFNPIYHPQKQRLEVQSLTSSGKLISHTQVNDPNKPVYKVSFPSQLKPKSSVKTKTSECSSH